MISSLLSIPGSKRKSKYNFLKPLPFQNSICEPFMGGAAKSLQTSLRPILGESNAALREIALASTSKERSEAFKRGYGSALLYITEDIDIQTILKYADVKQSMKQLRLLEPALADAMDVRWRYLTESLFESIGRNEPNAGLYYFCQKTCFGNVMRLNPKQTAFNVSWHVDKLRQALKFDFEQYIYDLQLHQWNPEIYSSFEQAIEAVENPADTWLLLDPPYIEQEGDRKMTPCYINHRVTTDAREQTFALSVDSLELGCKRDFPKIELCNYYSDRLNSEVFRLADQYGYSVEITTVGVCGALGNSGGRLIHGERRDLRERPVEVVWTLKTLF